MTDPPGSDEREEEGAAGPVLPDRPRARRFPGWLLIPLGGTAGGIVSGWAGAAFGCLVGLLIWKSRAA